MPELPEVETIRLDLEKALHDDAILSFQVKDPRLMTKVEQSRWKPLVPGQTWQAFRRQGKYLIIELSNGYRLVFHLRMTGQLVLSRKPLEQLFRLELVFKSGQRLYFCDQRRFGEIWLLEPGKSLPTRQPLGPDALNDLKKEGFVQIIKARTTRIHPLLLDQTLLAGVGNIYAQEALFKASIRPTRPGRRVSRAEAERLFDALRETLESAIVHRGSSSRNYRDGHGQEGSAQKLHAVYRKGGLPCPRCQMSLRGSKVGGRGTVFCPRCQR